MSKSVGFLQIIPKNKHSILASSPSSPEMTSGSFGRTVQVVKALVSMVSASDVPLNPS